jgi:hypothetical protein
MTIAVTSAILIGTFHERASNYSCAHDVHALIIASMKHFLLIFLMFALPFQVSWAAVGTYCQNEKGPVAEHFGHHKHVAEQNAESKTDQDQSLNNVDECGFCHLSCIKFLPVIPSLVTPAQKGAGFPLPAPRIYSSPTISPAEDPDWTLAA